MSRLKYRKRPPRDIRYQNSPVKAANIFGTQNYIPTNPNLVNQSISNNKNSTLSQTVNRTK